MISHWTAQNYILMLAYANYKSNKVKSNSLEPTFGTLEFNLDPWLTARVSRFDKKTANTVGF